ncbi:hypothetical protein KDA_74960 [Dictyobacter alpinus]|uniref:Uncharacterized protein n=1 Tax=Dictyobacter alpinus TaxID=2014873 RepID=A0A402BL02_9CHLR|nr:hypothetical protein [Dictyobacter alpinus]GCE32012.1 hypothetical protein KDA_74960 [Dictyobacter alpinus]
MASQPIYGDNGEIVDYYDDGLPDEQSPTLVKTAEQCEKMAQPQTEAEQEEPSENTARNWTVPDLLKGSNDLFIGVTIQHDDGDPQGPLVLLFAREVPDGVVHTKAFRAAELSQRAFLDNLQKAIAATMQLHFLAWSDRQRRRLEEEAKRKARPSQPLPKSSATTALGAANAHSSSTSATVSSTPQASPSPVPASTQKSSKATSKEATKKPEQKYATVSMFE